ncbi:uncharacterized protein LOC144422322 [Styela clava]
MKRQIRKQVAFLILCFMIIQINAENGIKNFTNCSIFRDENGEKIPPADKNQYAIENALDFAGDNDNYETVANLIENFLRENSEFDQCVGEEEVNDLVNEKLKELELNQKQLLLIVCISISISVFISIISIIVASVAHAKLRALQKKTMLPDVDDQNNLQTISQNIRNDNLRMQASDMGGSQIVLFKK